MKKIFLLFFLISTSLISFSQGNNYLTLSDSAFNVSAARNYKTINIRTNETWTFTCPASWVTLYKYISTYNIDSLEISVSENTTNAIRSAIITVRSTDSLITRYINITQAAGAKSISVSSSQLQLTGITQTSKINVSSNTSWIASSNDSWITLNKSNGTGDDSITITVAKNAESYTRTCLVKVMLPDSSIIKTITVIQAPDTTQLLSVDEASLNFASNANTQYLHVNSNSSWTVSSATSWASINKTLGTNDDSILVSVSENPTNVSRTDSITITSQNGITKVIPIYQAASPTYLTISDSTLEVPAKQSYWNKTILIYSNEESVATCPASWVKLVKYNEYYLYQGYRHDSLYINVDENTTNAIRTAVITLRTTDSLVTKYIYITQAAGAKSLSVTPTQTQLTGSAQTKTINVSSNTNWTASSSDSWITLNKSNGTGDDSITITVDKNAESYTRTGLVKVMLSDSSNVDTITVIQAADTTQLLSVDEASLNFASNANTQYLHVNSNSSWNITSSNSWVQVSKTVGSNNDSMLVSVSENPTNSVRTATLTASLQDGSIVKTITVYQTASSTYLNISDSIASAPAKSFGWSKDIDISSNAAWAVSCAQSWIRLGGTQGTGSDSLGIFVDENTTPSVRYATVIFRTTDSLVTKYIYVTQAAGSNSSTLAVSQNDIQVNANGETKEVVITSNSNWAVYNNNSWISINKSNGTGSDSLEITVAKNTGSQSRTGSVTVVLQDSSIIKTIAITQAAPTASVGSDSLFFVANSIVNQLVGINTTNPYYFYNGQDSWLTVTKNGDTLYIAAATNTSSSSRISTINVYSSDSLLINVIKVVQYGVVVETVKSVSISAGTLSSALTSDEAKAITELTISGTMDVRDFLFIRDSMPSLAKLNLANVSIALYQGSIDSSYFKSATIIAADANTIPEYALKGKTTLTHIVLPATLGAIANDAFSGCANLTSVTLMSSPSTLTIATSAFDNVDKTVCTLIVPTGTSGQCATNAVLDQFSNVKEATVTSVQENNSVDNLSIYPNPTHGDVYINGISENAQIEVFDTKGSRVAAEAVKGNKTQLFTTLPQGIYILKIKDSNLETNKRIIKK